MMPNVVPVKSVIFNQGEFNGERYTISRPNRDYNNLCNCWDWKISYPTGTMGYMQSLSFKTRYAAFALSLFSIAAAVMFHSNFADQMQMILLMKNLAMAGGLMLLAVSGRTAYSIDK